MKITFDPAANAAYITLGDRGIKAGEAAQQSDLIPTPSGVGQIILDFDAHGRLLGVEVLSARQVLAPELLATASS